MPPELGYLRDLAIRLVGRSGAGMDGALPLNPLVLKGWLDLYGLELDPQEVDVVMSLDSVLRHPDPDKASE